MAARHPRRLCAGHGARLEVTAPRGVTLARRSGLILPRQAELPESDIVVVGGIRVTNPVRTAFDLARSLPLVEAVVAVDALLHSGLVRAPELLSYAAEHRGWRGIRQVPQVIDLSEPRAESLMESRLRLVIVMGGLPRPEAQVVIKVAGSTYRFDLGYPQWRVAPEYDGQVHDSARSRVKDARRRNRVRRAGWDLLTYSAQDVYQRPEAIVREVGEAIAAAEALGKLRAVNAIRPEWR